MDVATLIEELKKIPDKSVLAVISADEEGNYFNEVTDITLDTEGDLELQGGTRIAEAVILWP